MTRLLALVWPDLRAPGAETAPFDPMLDALDDLSPRVEAVDVGVALVDVTGLGPLHGGADERRIAARAVMLVRAVATLPVRCGTGDNRWMAVLAARLARPGRTDAPAAFWALPPGAAGHEALRDLPLALLPADQATRQRFALFGLTCMGQLADLPRSAVGAQFGLAGERLQALARGQDPRPLVPRRRPERLATRAGFEPPLDGIGAGGLVLRRACAELCEGLRARHLAPGRATLELVREDAPPLRVQLAFPAPALEPDWIARLLLSRLEAAARSRVPSRATTSGIRPAVTGQRAENLAPNLGKSMLIGRSDGARGDDDPVTATTSVIWRSAATEAEEEPRVVALELSFDRLADPAVRQLPAFEARAGRWEELRWSLERLRSRFGDGRLWRAAADRPAASLPEHRSRLIDIGA